MVASSAEKPVGVPLCRVRRAQPPCCAQPDPTCPWCARVLDPTGDSRHVREVVRL